MSSKRSLYKSAASDTLGRKPGRKPLAQGRLVTDPPSHGLASSSPQSAYDHHQGLSKDGEQASTVSQSARATLAATHTRHGPDSSLNDRSGNMALHKQAISEMVESMHSVTPRREQPYIHHEASPHPLQPSMSLDLSDAESDVYNAKSHREDSEAFSRDVIVVDASRQPYDPSRSEVEVEMSYERSPVRVVCHTAAAVQSDLRDTGSVEQARRVAVDHLPSVQVLGTGDEAPRGQGAQPGSPPKHKAPLVVREHAVASNLVPEVSKPTKPEIVRNLFAKGEGSDSESHDPGEDRAAGDGSIEEQAKAGGNNSSSLTAEESLSKTKKKKKVARVVASRYMQTVGNTKPAKLRQASKAISKGPMKATDRTVLTSSKVQANYTKGPQSSALQPKRTGGVTRKTPTMTNSSLHKQTTPGTQSQSTFSYTPDAVPRGNKVSTPEVDPSVLPAPGGVDLSAIGHSQLHSSHSSAVSTPGGTEGMSSLFSKRPSRKMSRGNRSQTRPSSKGSLLRQQDASHTSQDSVFSTQNASTRKKEGEVTQTQLDILYARYLQWVYLDLKTKDSFRKQEKHFMAQAYALEEENEKMRRRLVELQQQKAKLQHLNMLEEMLDIQENGLNSVVGMLPELKAQHSTLAEALDTTRHQLLTKGVYIPDDDQQYNDALQHALHESEQLLGEISVMTRQKLPHAVNYAKSLGTMETAVSTQMQEMNKCQELMSAALTLATQECSLRIQDMQINS